MNYKRKPKPQKFTCSTCGQKVTDYEIFYNKHECKPQPPDHEPNNKRADNVLKDQDNIRHRPKS